VTTPSAFPTEKEDASAAPPAACLAPPTHGVPNALPVIRKAGSFCRELSAATQGLVLFQMGKEDAQLARKPFLDASCVLPLRNPASCSALPAKLPPTFTFPETFAVMLIVYNILMVSEDALHVGKFSLAASPVLSISLLPQQNALLVTPKMGSSSGRTSAATPREDNTLEGPNSAYHVKT
jgi:hypothetical protein